MHAKNNINTAASSASIANLAILLFYLLTLVYSYYIYQNFDFIEIFSLSILFYLLLAIVAISLNYDMLDFPKNKEKVFLATLTAIFLFLLSTSFNASWINSYYKTFPILDAEFSKGWFKDSVFHTSIIQSILNFGYPSIAQHGSPLMVYHVASHYFDSLILYVTGLEPYDSYGLLKSFKIFIYLSSLILIIGKISKSNIWLYSIYALILIPAEIGTWHAIGSHSLWVPSITLALYSPFIFKLITTDKRITHGAYIHLFFIIAFISLGKISLGLMLVTFIGSYLLISRPCDIRIYIAAIIFLAFMYIYSNSMVTDSSIMSFENLTLYNFYTYLIDPHIYLLTAVISFLILSITSAIYKSKVNMIITASAAITIIACFTLCSIAKKLSVGDQSYFMMATSQVILVFLILTTSKLITSKAEPTVIFSQCTDKTRNALTYATIIFLGYFFTAPSISMYKMNVDSLYERVKYANKGLYVNINSYVSKEDKHSLIKSIVKPNSRGKYFSSHTYFRDFRHAVYTLLAESNIRKNEALIFIPRELYANTIRNYGERWDFGMFIYSITGVPLTNAISTEKVRGYGLSGYDNTSKRINMSDLNHNKTCRLHDAKALLIIESIDPPEIKLHKCETAQSDYQRQ